MPGFAEELSLTLQHILNVSVYYSITEVNWSTSNRGSLRVRIT